MLTQEACIQFFQTLTVRRFTALWAARWVYEQKIYSINRILFKQRWEALKWCKNSTKNLKSSNSKVRPLLKFTFIKETLRLNADKKKHQCKTKKYLWIVHKSNRLPEIMRIGFEALLIVPGKTIGKYSLFICLGSTHCNLVKKKG